MLALYWRIVRSRPRLFIGLLCGIATIQLLPTAIHVITRSVLAWDVSVSVYLLLSGILFVTEPQDRMAANAAAQEEGEWTIFGITLAVTAFSFAAVIGEFANGTKDAPPLQRNLHVALVAVTLFVSWMMTQTTFAFRYAHEYYMIRRDTGGYWEGLQFPGERHPDYLDFLYFSLVLGMTFQVSDVQITARKFRRLASVHGLLSFLFNTIILALTVNIAAGLV